MGWFYVITEEIRECFEGKEADIFAVINGFSQDGQGCYYGSLSNLSKYCGIKSKTTTQNLLKSLVEKGALVKGEDIRNGVKFCSYTINPNWHGISKIDMGGIPKIDTNNKDINIKENRDINRKFIPPTIDEVRDYCQQRGNGIDPEEFIAHYTSNGWMVGKTRMKDWKSAIITWEKSRKKERKVPQKERKESVFEHNMRVYDAVCGTNYHEQLYGKKEECDEQ